ncbi:hypothetical protein [Tellurirhabdus rosea]|uniref:hypothetical protein n=1 Tax=Tellurirhabdus rosea TaxID=2674997 RepID=UPI00224E2174|nr:hypothetical protein [Tellurirhabdus rosea]
MELTGISATQLWRYRNDPESLSWTEGCVPYITFGGRIYYEIADIEYLLYMAQHRSPQEWFFLYYAVFGVVFELSERVGRYQYLKTLHERLFPSIPFADTLECWAESNCYRLV